MALKISINQLLTSLGSQGQADIIVNDRQNKNRHFFGVKSGQVHFVLILLKTAMLNFFIQRLAVCFVRIKSKAFVLEAIKIWKTSDLQRDVLRSHIL